MIVKINIIVLALVLGISHCESICSNEEADLEHNSLIEISSREKELNDVSENDVLVDLVEYVIGRNDILEGRKKKHKKKKYMKLFALMIFIKAILVPKIFGLVKFLTAKAYILSTIALILAALVTVKRPRRRETEQVINLLPKSRKLKSKNLAYRYWSKRRVLEPSIPISNSDEEFENLK